MEARSVLGIATNDHESQSGSHKTARTQECPVLQDSLLPDESHLLRAECGVVRDDRRMIPGRPNGLHGEKRTSQIVSGQLP